MQKSGRDKFNKIRPLLMFLSKLISFLPLKLKKFLFNLFKGLGGNLGIVLRYILLKGIAKKCGDNVSVHQNVYLLSPENMELGKNISIHPMCYLDATGGLVIGDEVSLAHGVTVMSTTHSYEDMDVPIKYQPISLKKTILKNNIWVGAKSTVLAGVIINDGVVVGASSVVTKIINKNFIVVGSPAKVLKKRRAVYK
ncbi:hypothetical protein TEHN7118_2014 [Tetragenococcus halophilus subsp. halophilus]|uniref:Acyltransferase n=1 Tax=Tetragenococcus halophilus subsp. halophilus TaxID=1513897 RepID=A0A2H6CW39_TETHA|nr:acyltransferase [Tetragenococcus halophilus]GBD69208.1 hypothetical protein TEHN7118_2014 [Tetragenococcus halophilus subsp. halophilus]